MQNVRGLDGSAVILGGDWNNGANSGSRAANWNNVPSNGNNNIGARFAAVATVQHHYALLFLWGSRPVPNQVPAIKSSFGKLRAEW